MITLFKNLVQKRAISMNLIKYSNNAVCTRCHSRFFDCLAHPKLSATLTTDQK
jgi:hypothetical protein